MTPECERKVPQTEKEPESKQDVKKQSVKLTKQNVLEKIKSIDSSAPNAAGEMSPTKLKKKKGLKLKYLIDETNNIDILHHKAYSKVECSSERCLGSLLKPGKTIASYDRSKEEKISQAIDFINQFYASVKRQGSKTHQERISEVIQSIRSKGTYELKETELCFGARTAWRNAPRCIGRIQWSRLQVFDARYVTTARGIFEALCNHLKYATNKGNIRSAITIFRQRTEQGHDYRIWNSQFISYAGYKMEDGSTIGDQSQLEFTEICIKLGWKAKHGEFDVLPLVLQANGLDPEWFDIPPELILEVNIVHPIYEKFKDLNLKWYCVPGVSSMLLDVGGIEFTACPFNGWYMGTEIGRDLADVNRYDKLGLIADTLGLDRKSNSSLWKDKALIELNHAILYSFQKNTITITDHHSAAESFMKHHQNETVLRGGCPGDWVWVVPPLSSHLTPDGAWKTHVWKQKSSNTENRRLKRRVYFSDIARAVKFSAKLMGKAMAKRIKCTILYATETGKSERFAKTLSDLFKHAFDPRILCMKDYDVVDLENETLLLMVTSTFGNGDPPENGREFKKILIDMQKERSLLNTSTDITNPDGLSNVRFSVFALGNSSYPKFCQFGKFLDDILNDIGAERVYDLGLGDELCGQEESFRKWSFGAFKSAFEYFCIDTDSSLLDILSNTDLDWSPQTIRLTIHDEKKFDLYESLHKLHERKIYPCKFVSKRNLQTVNSGRITLLVEISTTGYSSELQYKPGDHVGIFASNRKNLVDAILDKLSNAPPPDQMIKIEILKEKSSIFGAGKQWVVDDQYLPFTLRHAFTNLLDITSPLSQDMLKYLSSQVSADSDREKLEKLSQDHIAYEKWKLNGYPNLVEVLDEFPSLRPNASLLITKLPKLQPRFYSISSSPKQTDDINITVGLIEYTPVGKSTHYGVCSKWLDEMNLNDSVPMFVREAPSFRLPEDKTCPIIMVCAGTGLAPFRSFWQERKIDKEMLPNPNGINGVGWGKLILYFGCRQKNVDEIYRSEIDQMLKENVLSEYHPAYSREPNKKKFYVQDVMEKNGESLFDLICNKNGHFYVCGDVRMAADVTQTLEQQLVKHSNSKFTLQDAKDFLHSMKENLRFHEDIFGNNMSNNQSK
ncbi:Nitric oxide brain [Brachionus plicatilis]|uniref:Nitric oxide synthase n=1 Tax=Brachionus plicatilis TaxID=10195 RepID=A0A3M7R287_BRAPC|nr:Nitric oxide brain [Brachionus plicatilis]